MLHLRRRFEAAGGQDDAAARGEPAFAFRCIDDQAVDRAVRAGDQAFGGGVQAHFDAAMADVVFEQFENIRTQRTAAHLRIFFRGVEVRYRRDFQHPQRVVPFEGIVAAAPAHDDLRAVDLGQILEVGFQFAHAARDGRQHVVGHVAARSGFQIGQAGFVVENGAHAAAGADRNAARIGHLLDQQHAGAGVMRGDGGRAAGKAEADHDDIPGFVEDRCFS